KMTKTSSILETLHRSILVRLCPRGAHSIGYSPVQGPYPAALALTVVSVRFAREFPRRERTGPMTMTRTVVALSFGILTAGLMLAAPAQAAPEAKAAAPEAKAATAPTISAADLKNGMRKLWTDHTTYTRAYIVSAVAGLPDLPTVTQRLLRNQDDIGAAIKPIYGEEAGKKLAALLRDHILVAADI